MMKDEAKKQYNPFNGQKGSLNLTMRIQRREK